jgi:hypothetical protein
MVDDVDSDTVNHINTDMAYLSQCCTWPYFFPTLEWLRREDRATWPATLATGDVQLTSSAKQAPFWPRRVVGT